LADYNYTLHNGDQSTSGAVTLSSVNAWYDFVIPNSWVTAAAGGTLYVCFREATYDYAAVSATPANDTLWGAELYVTTDAEASWPYLTFT
jgi:hypothetical protein